MSSLRPLVTITILIVVGAYLYVKINEGPLPTAPGSAETWHDPAPADVPPLATTPVAPATGESAAQPWPTTAPLATAGPAYGTGATDAASGLQPAPGTADVATDATPVTQDLPAVPPIPKLPDVGGMAGGTSPGAIGTTPIPGGLPANVPIAQYPDELTAGNTGPIGGDTTTTPPSAALADSTTPGGAIPAMQPAAPSSIDATEPASQTPNTSDFGAAPMIDAAAQSTPPNNPLRQSAPPSAAPDRYATGGVAQLPETPTTPIAETPAPASFATSWPEIQSALDRGELARAHKLLSPWHDEATLTPADAEKVDTLLSQLAGTVVYSTEHQLKPAHIVKNGETLESIAEEYNVPWQLLAKINGIPATDQLRPGQELKVVPGPFSAVVNLQRGQLTLSLDGLYAGRFPVTVPVGSAMTEGTWLVEQKLATPASRIVQSSTYTAAPPIDRTIVLRTEAVPGQPAGGQTIALTTSRASAGASSPAIEIAPGDAEELSDILSIGSQVVIRR